MKIAILEIKSADLGRINEIMEKASVTPDQIISITFSHPSSTYKIFYRDG